MGGNSCKLSEDQKSGLMVVIVGAGYAGIECAARLKKEKIPFKIIDPKTFFHHNIGALRATVIPEFCKFTAVPLKESFGESFIQGLVTSVNFQDKQVNLENSDEPLSFTHLVLATGSTGHFPARTGAKTVEEIQKESDKVAAEIKKSSKIVIIGGGSVGVELAGEIRDVYPKSDITILQSGDRILSSVKLGENLRKNTQKLLEYRNIVVKLGERVTNLESLVFDRNQAQTVTTEKGNSYEADIVFKCTGLKSNSSLVSKILDADQVDQEYQRVIVTPCLVVRGFETDNNVFAIGDICNTDEEKMAAHAGVQANCVVDNIIKSVLKQELGIYVPKFVGMIIPVGSGYGTGIFNGWRLPSLMCYFYKCKNLFNDLYWGIMDQKMPQ